VFSCPVHSLVFSPLTRHSYCCRLCRGGQRHYHDFHSLCGILLLPQRPGSDARWPVTYWYVKNKTLHTFLVTEVIQNPPGERWTDLICWPESALEKFLFFSASEKKKFWMSDVIHKMSVSVFLPQTGHVSPRDMKLSLWLADFHSIHCW